VHPWSARPTLASLARSAAVLAAALDTPVAAGLVRAVTRAPRGEDRRVAGVPTAIFRPAHARRRGPALVLLSGATARGRFHPGVRRLAESLARVGYATYVPDADGLPRGVITLRTRSDAVAVSAAAADEAAGGVALAGISVGATLALLAAADESLRTRARAVAGIAPWADLKAVIRLATTGFYGDAAARADPFLALVVARSLAAGLPEPAGREALLGRLLAVPDEAREPLSGLRPWPGAPLGPAGAAVVELLANRDPARFEGLYQALPGEMREAIEGLSPIRVAARIAAPVELATSPRDRYFPTEESRSLVAALPHGRLTVTGLLDHAVPRPTLAGLAGAAALAAVLARTLAAAAERR
jgi:hypothetical protein